jgi:hypothetical protein
MQGSEDQQFREKVLAAAEQMREQAKAGRPIRNLLDEIAVLALGGRPGFTLSEDGRTLLLDGRSVMWASEVLAHEIGMRTRREWAQKIRDEFGRYHNHNAEGSGECAACGSRQAADWMDPDFTQDGPTRG